MKVLYVIPSYEPAWAFGGTVTATSQLCRGLAKKGIDISVYTTDADGKGAHLDVTLGKVTELGGVKVTYFRCDYGVRKAFYSKSLAARLDETIEEFDLVHVSAIWQWIQRNVYRACKKYGKAYVVTPNGSFKHYPWRKGILGKRLYWHLVGKTSVRNAAALHFTTEAEREDSLSNLKMLRGIPNFVVPNGMQLGRGSRQKDVRRIFGISPDDFLILFLGRVEKIKGLDFIIRALGKLHDQSIYLLIVGPEQDGDYCNYLKTLTERLRLAEHIFWQGSVVREEIWDYYEQADILVQMSYSENFALTVVEAMSCGLPVLINSNIGIWKEVQADNCGFIVEQDMEVIADAIGKIAANKGILHEMSINAMKSVQNRYDCNKVASLMIRAYEDILFGGRTPELEWR